MHHHVQQGLFYFSQYQLIEIAQLAEDCGIQALTIHGRTRACL
ncbi:tRNA-dihydrouridine synthase, partial [Citrobacter freundii]